MRDNDEGGSSNIDPRHGSSDKARWDAEVMEQGGPRGSEKWGDNTAVTGAAGGKQPQAQDRRHPTPGKRNTAPLVGGAETDSSPVIHRKFSSYLDACMGEPTVTEIKNGDKNSQEKEQAYLCNLLGNPMKMWRAEKLAKKRNLQGNDLVSENSFDVLSNMEIVNMAAHMGVNIPDDDFTVIDVIRELEKSRANIAKKINTDIKQTEEVLLITNAAGESSHLNTAWGMRKM
ncbi:hypothetical protein D1007_60868 [Hordeum vulgare]|nr:hypothetical protein D1007_60868 [Hordeum vulgare]